MADEQGKNIFSYTPDKAVKIIFDTDMDTDVDDTGALAVLYSYAQEGKAEVLATVGSCNSGHAVKCIGGINAYYGFPKVPVGISPKCPSSGKSPYQSVIAEKYGKDYPDDKAARPALEVYREVLSSAEDNSVVITVIGALNNLCDLLRSQGDKYSPLNGIELVNRKVKLCIIMGGRFPESAPGGEYNINLDVDAAYYVIHNCPVSILWSGQEIGEAIFTGDMRNEMEEDDPVRLAYDLYGNDKTDSYKRQSWDLTTILFAVEGAKDYWYIQTGTAEINTAGHLLNADFAPAYNNWIAGEGKDARLIQKARPQTLAEILNRRMVTVRKGKSTVLQPHREKGERMKKIGIFLDEIKDENIDEKQKFAKLGYNTGNLLFWHSLKTNLGLDVRSRWYIDHIDRMDLNEYKAFVTTDLIWIRQMQDFSYLNKVLDVIGTLPLVPISVGLQCNSYLPDFKLHPETLKVLQRISERCVMGVRGSYTAEILSKYGITNFKIIGCPSMYMDTPGFESVNNSGTAPKRISLNFETFYGKLTKPKTDLLQYGARHDFEFVEQVQATPEAKHIPDEAALKEILGWLDRKRHCFFDIGQWREYMNGVDFSLGTRFHGNVLALWEGVPALFFTCDSRTKELCEHFSLPRMDISEFDPEKSIEYYYEKADYSEFHKQYPQRLKEWNEFLEMNGLSGESSTIDIKSNETRTEGAIYYCKTARQLLCALLLVESNQHIKHNYLFISTFLKNIYPDIGEYICKKTKKFEKVVVYNTNEITSNDTVDPDVFLQDITKYYDKLLSKNDIDISLINNFHVFSALRFSLYLVSKHKRFNLYEDSNGSASITGLTQWVEQREKVAKRPLALKYGLIYGESEYVNKIFIHDNGRVDSKIPKEKIVEFNIQDLIKSSDENYLKALYMFYNHADTSDEENLIYDYVILSQYYDLNNIKLTTASFWGAIADCFIPDGATFVIKPHPADNTDFLSTFDKRELVNKNVPYELFESLSKIKNIICVTSTAICNSENSAIRLGKPYMSFEIFTVYSILYLISKQITGKTKISYYGNHFENFAQLVTNKFNNHIILSSSDDMAKCNIAIYDDFQVSKPESAETIICFYSRNMEDDLFLTDNQYVIIHMNAKSKVEAFIEDRYICIRSHDEKVLKCFSEISETVFLNHSRIFINLESVTSEMIMKKKILEMQKGIVELNNKLNKLEQKLDSVNITVKFNDK